MRVSRSLSGDPVCGPTRPPLARPQLAALPRSGLLLHKMLSSEKSCASSGPADKEVDASGDCSGQEDPSHSGNLQEGPGVRMFMGNLEVPPCPDSQDQPGT